MKLVLEANGFDEFRVIKNNKTGLWELPENWNTGRPRFILHTGTETADEKELLLNIYNGNWSIIPEEIAVQLREVSPTNNYGEIIRIIMITSSGAEGINLKNTRFVHITEPYWNMTRIEQVIGRARRICSHQDLPQEDRTVKVFFYISCFSKLQKGKDKKSENIELMLKDTSKFNEEPITTDENLFEIATIKNKINETLLNAVKETAIDCRLYGNRACYDFGIIHNPQSISSYPDIESDISNRDEEQLNQAIVKERRFKKWVDKKTGKQYVVSDDMVIYTYDSYMEYKTTNNYKTLQKVGVLKKENGHFILV
jgi:hypothetical protein